MSELASYSIQAVFFALVAVVVVSRSKKTDLYHFALISVWLIGIVSIYARYGNDQVLFYSNDQLFHQQIIEYYIPIDGFQLSAVFGLRYLLTAPVYLISLLGLNPMLVIKFIQLCALLLTYNKAKTLAKRFGFKILYFQLPLIAGPLPLFMSMLSLRDVILAYLTLTAIFPLNKRLRPLSIASIGLLRPHLAVALIFGFTIEAIINLTRSRFQILLRSLLLITSYLFGAIGFVLGNYLSNEGNIYFPNTIFSIDYISRLALNIFSLQFLVLDGKGANVVESSTEVLLFSRLLFVETFLAPSIFLVLFFRHNSVLKRESLQIGAALFFFLGLVFQNAVLTNSTRQNLPFITVMGLIGMFQLCDYRKSRSIQIPLETSATKTP
jgi:hypothetical protein